jgi:hypothetical protein
MIRWWFPILFAAVILTAMFAIYQRNYSQWDVEYARKIAREMKP